MKNQGIRYHYRKKKIIKAAKHNKRKVIFPVLSSVFSIGIVSDTIVDVDAIYAMFSKHPDCILFDSGIRPKGNDDSVVYRSDMNIWGLPQKKRIETFINQPFDLLINLSGEVDDCIEYICARSKAKFKINRSANGVVYDLVIEQTEGDISTFLSEIKRTLSNFNRNI